MIGQQDLLGLEQIRLPDLQDMIMVLC